MTDITYTNRKIYFYELNMDYLDDFDTEDGDQFREFFSRITKLAKTKNKLRYQPAGEKILFIQDIHFIPADKVIVGKLRCVRQDILPEIINMSDDTTKGIEIDDVEGIVETTHFVIDHSKLKKRLCIEFNQFGAKVNDFIYYCSKIGTHLKMTQHLQADMISRDNLVDIQKKIHKLSEIVVRVQKTQLPRVKNISNELYSSMEKGIDYFNPEYIEMSLKFDYKKQSTREGESIIKNIIRKFVRNSENKNAFNSLYIKAENSEEDNRIEIFNLLIENVKKEIRVQKKAKFRSLISEDVFNKMTSELLTLKI